MKGEAFLTGLFESLFLRAPFRPIDEPEPIQRKAVDRLSGRELNELAEDAYIYGYPLVLMDITARTSTNVPTPDTQRAPLNQFARVEILPSADRDPLHRHDARFNSGALPDVDTVSTQAFLDLSREPMVLTIPDSTGRYYVMPLLDAFSNVFAAPGSRTTGTGELELAIVGPNWHGTLPPHLSKVEAPTNLVWLRGRTQVDGHDDLSRALNFTDRYTLTPLSEYGQVYTAPENMHIDLKVDMRTPPTEIVARLGDRAFFVRLASLLRRHRPPREDSDMLRRLELLGLAHGQFAPEPSASRAIVGASRRAVRRMQARFGELGHRVNGWRIDTTLGSYDTRYLDRAAAALCSLGAGLAEDTVVPTALTDSDGRPLDGEHDYVLHFEQGQEPPALAFWSLTLYDRRGQFAPNALERFAIGSRERLRRNADGSLDILIQHEPPRTELLDNWLPAPLAHFQLAMRVHWAEDSMLNGAWIPPRIDRCDP
jgi:hypothetical protein